MAVKKPAPTADLLSIFNELRALLARYSPPLTSRDVKADKPQYHLWSIKDVVIAGRKKKEVYFAGAILQKGYVGFYYMPTYAEPEIKKVFPRELIKLLKGMSCFHIKELPPQLKKQIRAALKVGFQLYKEHRWV